MKFAIVAPNVGACSDPRAVVELARAAEDAGWDGFFMWDTIEYGEEPLCDTWTTLAAVASSTGRIRLGTTVLSMARRRPWKVAREAVTLDHLSGGRVILGLGAGWDDSGFTSFGESADDSLKAEKFDEGLAILRGLWLGEPFSFEGRHFAVREVTFRPRPVHGSIPIWVAANNSIRVPGPIRRAVRQDGVLGDIRPGEVEAILAMVADVRPPGTPFDVVLSVEDPERPLPSPATVAEWEATGVTWIRYEIDSLTGASGSLAGAQRLIADGPPR